MSNVDTGVWYRFVSYEKAHLSHIEHLNSIYKVEKEHFFCFPNWHFLFTVLQGEFKGTL